MSRGKHWRRIGREKNCVIFLARKFLCDILGNSREDSREHRAKEGVWHNFTVIRRKRFGDIADKCHLVWSFGSTVPSLPTLPDLRMTITANICKESNNNKSNGWTGSETHGTGSSVTSGERIRTDIIGT